MGKSAWAHGVLLGVCFAQTAWAAHGEPTKSAIQKTEPECTATVMEIDGEQVRFFRTKSGKVVHVPELEIVSHAVTMNRVEKETQELEAKTSYAITVKPTPRSLEHKALLTKKFGEVVDAYEVSPPTLVLHGMSSKTPLRSPVKSGVATFALDNAQFSPAVSARAVAGNLGLQYSGLCASEFPIASVVSSTPKTQFATYLLDTRRKFSPFSKAITEELNDLADKFRRSNSLSDKYESLFKMFEIIRENPDPATKKVMEAWGLTREDFDTFAGDRIDRLANGVESELPFDLKITPAESPHHAGIVPWELNLLGFRRAEKAFAQKREAETAAFIAESQKQKAGLAPDQEAAWSKKRNEEFGKLMVKHRSEEDALSEKLQKGWDLTRKVPSQGVFSQDSLKEIDSNHQQKSVKTQSSYQPK